MKRFICVFMASLMILGLSGCTWDDPESVANDGVFRVTMIPDLGGVNDQSFNQSALEGLYELRDETGAQISYVESKQSSDFEPNIDRAADGPADLIVTAGFVFSDATAEVAAKNLDKNFAIVDFSYGDEIGNNVTGITFRSQEAAFMVGYIAGMTTKTNKVGFVGGMRNLVIDQFQYGYEAGVLYASKERNVPIEIMVQYAESFSDAAKGKAIASRMYSSDCDIVFHAAGGVGYGVIESAKDNHKFAIGVDKDQSSVAPDNVLTSAVKNAGKAVKIVAKKLQNGEQIGGINYEFGLEDNCVGIPENHKNMDEAVYKKALEIAEIIKSGKITVPFNAETFNIYKENLK